MIVIGAIFLALRLPGISLPFHQDEWKNVSASATAEGAGHFFAHPPLMQMIFVADYKLFGQGGFRALPLLFSIGAGVLLYAVVSRRAGKRAAAWATGLFALCFYNVFGSLQADVDGAILPFFFLLAVYFYDKWAMGSGKKWFGLFALALLAGFLIKLSFIIVIGAFIVDHLWTHRRERLGRHTAIAAAWTAGFGLAYVAILYLIQAAYPAFSISFMLGHADQYAGTAGRNWMQILVQVAKAVYYLSPLLLVPMLFMSREALRRMRVFAAYLALGLAFYLVIFDFSQGALDKYLMFAIVPLSALAGTILSAAFRMPGQKEGEDAARNFPAGAIVAGLLLAVALVSLNFLPQSVAALYPKTEWFSRVLHGQWNVLTPLTGGSGPVGFYVSFLFIAASYISSIAIGVAALVKKQWKVGALVMIIISGISYNLIFAEELMFGRLNGSSAYVMSRSVAFIAKDADISKVLTYNDIGNMELSAIGKYSGRFYAAPGFEEGHKERFAGNRYYMVIDIPHLYESGFYGSYFSQCSPIFGAFSGHITGKVYDCQNAKIK